MNKWLRILSCFFCLAMLVGMVPAFAEAPYNTYTYDYWQVPVESPHAYTPYLVVETAKQDFGALKSPENIFIDSNKRIYIADAGNNRVLVMNEKGEYLWEIAEFLNPETYTSDHLTQPKDVFVWEQEGHDPEIYVADHDNDRIVVFTYTGACKRIIGAPSADVLPEGFIYKPRAVVVDKGGRIYVVCSSTNYGVVSMTAGGEFTGFVGAQKVRARPWQIFRRLFMTEAQKAKEIRFVPTEYNNIAIDESGFLYVTTSSLNPWDQQNAIWSRSRAGDYATLKKLNPSGTDILKRTGFFPPSGEVDVVMRFGEGNANYGPSTIVDVAIGPNGTYTIIDAKRQRIFTYNEEGRLLHVFGAWGTQFGNFMKVSSIGYLGNDMVVLDAQAGNLVFFRRTTYGEELDKAITLHRERKYDDALEHWETILQMNSNCDLAYVGIGKAFYRKDEYKNAMEYFENANDVENYSRSFKEYRKEIAAKIFILIPIVIVGFFVLLWLFLKRANKINKKGQEVRKHTIPEELYYIFHVIVHPFDGFWDIKHEKRGSARTATIILAVTVFAFIAKATMQGYIADPFSYRNVSLFYSISGIIVPVILFVVANWCLTTLFDGEGSLKDIYITVCYSLAPIPLLFFPAILLSNFVTLEELALVNMLFSAAYIWMGLLIFFGVMVIHDYSIFKNIITTLGSILGMGVIMFVAMLFISLIQRMIGFVISIVNEITFRM